MIVTDHVRIRELGILSGPLDEATRASWPTWAATHIAACAECQSFLLADTVLRRAFTTATPSAEPPPPPSLAALRLRAPPSPMSLAVLASGHAPFESGVFRSSSLQITVRGDAVAAFDPAARHLAMFLVHEDGRVRTLGEVRTDPPGATGVRVERVLPGDRRGRVVAMAVADELDVGLWSAWLGENPTIAGAQWALDQPGDRVHIAALRVHGQVALAQLRVQTAPRPPQSDVQEILDRARPLGAAGHERAAVLLFQDALRHATVNADSGGVVQADLGLATGFFSLGYHEDARGLLLDLAQREPLDAVRASQLGCALAWCARHAGHLDEAEAWLDQIRRVDAASGWLEPLERSIALARHDGAGVLAAAATATRMGAEASAYRAAHVSIARCWLGQPQGGEPVEVAETVEVRLWQIAARAVGTRHAQGDWPVGLCGEVERELDAAGRGSLTVWDAGPVGFLVGEIAQDDPGLASRLLEARHLQGARSPGVHVLVAEQHMSDVLLSSSARLRGISVSPESLVKLIGELRANAVLGRSTDEEAQLLRGLLLPRDLSSPTRLVVGSHALLEGVPWPLLLDDGRGVSVTEVLGRGAACLIAPTSTAVMSFANPRGDLPLAETDVPPGGMAVHRTGGAATISALRNLPELGLLHLGVHVGRRDGVPEIHLADGVLTAVELCAFQLRGSPIVLLAGCASADEPRNTGIERSLASALLTAGASAVVATRWPLQDAEAHAIFRPLAEAWPISDVEATLSDVIAALKETGFPSRVWAAPALFRA